MITGDHPDTAVAIARKSGIMMNGRNKTGVLTGDTLKQLSQEQLIEELGKGVSVFARTTPEQKMKIVAALKAMDKVVAMTGDGVNDSPALKAADVGVAMGEKGTDVARESAQIVLLDDNFASIVAGVEEGRAIFSNIKKFTNYVLVSNGPEILPYLIYILLPVPLALTVIQILSIDLGTDIIPSMGLGQEPPDPEEMRRPPRDRSEGLLTPPLMVHSHGWVMVIRDMLCYPGHEFLCWEQFKVLLVSEEPRSLKCLPNPEHGHPFAGKEFQWQSLSRFFWSSSGEQKFNYEKTAQSGSAEHQVWR